MPGINDYSTTASNNTMYVPEGCAPSVVNDGIRQVQADLRTWYNDAEWLNLGHTPTYVSASSFSVPGNQTSFYTVGRRIKIADSSTLYGTISSSAYTTLTTVGVTLDSGSISASISAISVGISKVPLGGTGSSVTNSSLIDGSTAQTLTNKTLTSPKINQILDTNGNESINLTATSSAVNELTVGNAATGNAPYISASGDDTNIPIALQPKGTGTFNVLGTSASSAEARLFEDTDNGSNYIGLKAPSSISSNLTLTLPSADGTSGQAIVTNGSGTLSFASTGKLVNRAITEYSTSGSGGTAIPLDSTIPQITEGAAVFTSSSYTPSSASNIIRVRAKLWCDNATQAYVLAAMFKDSNANAVAAGGTNSTGGAIGFIELNYNFTAGSTSAFTISLRTGVADGSTTYWNRDSAGNTLGGMTSYIEITEYLP